METFKGKYNTQRRPIAKLSVMTLTERVLVPRPRYKEILHTQLGIEILHVRQGY